MVRKLSLRNLPDSRRLLYLFGERLKRGGVSPRRRPDQTLKHAKCFADAFLVLETIGKSLP